MGEKVGVIPPPAGVTADFDYSHPWKFKTDLIIVGVGLFLATISLAMRVWTRWHLLSKFGWDDGKNFLHNISRNENNQLLTCSPVSMIAAWVRSIELEAT